MKALEAWIADGANKANGTMPAYAKQGYTDQQIQQIAEFVAALKTGTPPSS